MTHAAALPAHAHHRHSIGFNLGIIAVCVAMGGVALAYLITAAGHVGTTGQDRGMVARSLGATRLTIPAAWVTDPSSSGSFSREVDLSVSLPLGPNASLREIDVTLTERSRVTPSAALLDGVYLHEFKTDQLTGPPGLIGKPLQAEEGFESETIWYDPLTSSPFVAKCAAPIVADAAARCLRTVNLGPGIAAIYSFDSDVLANWRKFDAEMHPLLNRIGAL